MTYFTVELANIPSLLMVFGDLLHELLVLVGALDRLAASGRHLCTRRPPDLRYTSLSRDEVVFIYPSALSAECAVVWEVEQLEHSDLASNLRDNSLRS